MRFKLFIPVLAIIFCCSFACNSTQKTNTENIAAQSNSNTTSQATDEKEVGNNNEQGVSTVIVKAVGNTMSEMAFDPKEIKVKANTKVKITLVNLSSDKMMVHNLLVVQKGKADEVGVAAIKAGEAKKYIPDNPAIIAASDLVDPLKKTILEFDAPAPGVYAFLCTYPGHHLSMRGRFVVEE